MSSRAYAPNIISFPTLQAECKDTEARSLKKINDLQYQMSQDLAELIKPGGSDVATTSYVYGDLFAVPAGADLLDVACYNPTDLDVWVMVFGTAPQAGMVPLFLIRVYAHNHAYYEAMSSVGSIAPSTTFYIAVSSNELNLALNATPVFLAIRHS